MHSSYCNISFYMYSFRMHIYLTLRHNIIPTALFSFLYHLCIKGDRTISLYICQFNDEAHKFNSLFLIPSRIIFLTRALESILCNIQLVLRSTSIYIQQVNFLSYWCGLLSFGPVPVSRCSFLSR